MTHREGARATTVCVAGAVIRRKQPDDVSGEIVGISCTSKGVAAGTARAVECAKMCVRPRTRPRDSRRDGLLRIWAPRQRKVRQVMAYVGNRRDHRHGSILSNTYDVRSFDLKHKGQEVR